MIGAALFLANALVYLIGEAISAAAWSNPAYSYSHNVISDLGVPSFNGAAGYPDGSPLFWLMNTVFISHGTILVLAAVLVAPAVSRSRARAFLTSAAVQGVGLILVGMFPGAPDASTATRAGHTLGAAFAILGGNVTVIIAGAALRRTGRPLGTVLVSLGTLGIASAIALFTYWSAVGGSGAVIERIAVYTIVGAQLLVAVVVLVGRFRPGSNHHRAGAQASVQEPTR
ncbi:DUF998 domain-containing protein [Nocardioides sp. NPDC006273]|uniref:DUF998 domain-containing protein n=1 Tax=Nocardioides sp. NPDC006273 TaxID=3155598 RepID=UPI0033B0F9A7